MQIRSDVLRLAQAAEYRIPRLVKAYRAIRRNWRAPKQARESALGFSFVGNTLMQEGAFEPAETSLVKQLLAHVDVLINIGANVGYYCCHALRSGRAVVAFEPLETNLRYLYRNVRANRWEDHIEVFPLALSDRAGILTLYGGGTGASLVKGWDGAPEKLATLVPVSTLDTVLGHRFLDRRCLLVVDIEGAECAMLRGATGFLDRRPRPLWLVEILRDEHQPTRTGTNPHFQATFDLFFERGYEACTADNDRRFVGRKEVSALETGAPGSLGTHNFLFLERGRKSEILGDAPRCDGPSR